LGLEPDERRSAAGKNGGGWRKEPRELPWALKSVELLEKGKKKPGRGEKQRRTQSKRESVLLSEKERNSRGLKRSTAFLYEKNREGDPREKESVQQARGPEGRALAMYIRRQTKGNKNEKR